MTKKLYWITLSVTLLCTTLSAQELRYTDISADTPQWVKLMYVDEPDPSKVIAAYESYYRDNPFVKNKHTQYYKRWLRSLSRDLGTNGLAQSDKRYLVARNRESAKNRTSTTWSAVGPWDWDHEAADRSYAPGAAHVYTVQQCASAPDVMYAGTATAGIWRSSDRGASWSCITHDRIFNGLTALAVSDVDADLVFAEMHSNVFKTTDAGSTWTETGDAGFQQLSLNTKDIVFAPGSSSVVWICTDGGLYESVNAGNTWTLREAGDFLELEFHPTDHNTIYAVRTVGDGTEFLRSLNGGSTFTVQSTGWPSPDINAGQEQRRTEIAVSPDDPDLVVALATGSANGGSGLYGIYRSTDAGSTWSFACCGPQPAGPPSAENMNLMGWSDEGLDDGGQYYYDLALDISPTNADSIFVGGVNLWVSADGGSTFVCPAKWSHSYKPEYVHADIHDIRYMPGTKELWVAGDGGIFFSDDNGANFTRKINGISGTDFWGFGVGKRDDSVMLGGTYHNGTLLRDNNVYANGWVSTDGGDNIRGFVQPVSEREVFSDYNIKYLSGDRAVDNATRSFQFKPNASYIIGESSDILFHPVYWGTWYTGHSESLWLTADNGFSFEEVHNFGQKVVSLAMCFSRPETMVVTTWPGWWDKKHVWITQDAGASWEEITPTSEFLQGNTWVPYDVEISAVDPERIWLVRTSMYSGTDLGGVEIIESTDGGSTWVNITGDFPLEEAATCLAHHPGSERALYIGTRRGVYYSSETTDGWELYSDGLPASTSSTRLAINSGSGKIYNGTNRSAWSAPLYEAFGPAAMIAVDRREKTCVGDTVEFFDNSEISISGTTWQWTFPGGVPATSMLRDPKVVYSTAGVYDASLIVSSGGESDTISITGIIEIRDDCGVDKVPGLSMSMSGNPDHAIASDFSDTVESFTVLAWVKPDGIQNDFSAVLMNDDQSGGLNFREGNNTLGYHWPGGQWWWDSDLQVPADSWSHVAMVVTPTAVRVYLDGEMSEHVTATDPVALTTLRIGSYKGWGDRNFKGEIDEVAIYTRALTTDEVRERRHLTLSPEVENGLLAYYQFNEATGQVYDKAGTNDAVLNGMAHRVRSRAPLGYGTSSRQAINGTGSYSFDQQNVRLTFEAGDEIPNGDVWISHVLPAPDTFTYDGNVALLTGYWIIDNYGTSTRMSFDFEADSIGFVSSAMSQSDSLDVKVWTRGANAELGGWAQISDVSAVEPGMGGRLTAEASKPVVPGQIMPTRSLSPFGTAPVRISTPGGDPSRRGGAYLALDLYNNDSLGVVLPLATYEELESWDSVAVGSIAFNVEADLLVFFNGDSWSQVAGKYETEAIATGATSNIGLVYGDSTAQGAILSMGANGFLNPAVTSDNSALNVGYPAEGSMLYLADHASPAIYDGTTWRLLQSAQFDLSQQGDGGGDPILAGLAVGDHDKYSGSRLDMGTGAAPLGIPVVPFEAVIEPVAGLIVFDPNMKLLCLYTGSQWQSLQFK